MSRDYERVTSHDHLAVLCQHGARFIVDRGRATEWRGDNPYRQYDPFLNPGTRIHLSTLIAQGRVEVETYEYATQKHEPADGLRSVFNAMPRRSKPEAAVASVLMLLAHGHVAGLY